MNLDDFGLSILASYLANKADKVAEFVFGRNAEPEPDPMDTAEGDLGQEEKPPEHAERYKKRLAKLAVG